MFDQVSEKAVREILRITHGVSAAAHETVKRRPIGLAKLGQCGLRNLRIGLASPRRENRAPVSGRKQTTLARSVSREGLHVNKVLSRAQKERNLREKIENCMQRALQNPFVRGKAKERNNNGTTDPLQKNKDSSEHIPNPWRDLRV